MKIYIFRKLTDHYDLTITTLGILEDERPLRLSSKEKVISELAAWGIASPNWNAARVG